MGQGIKKGCAQAFRLGQQAGLPGLVRLLDPGDGPWPPGRQTPPICGAVPAEDMILYCSAGPPARHGCLLLYVMENKARRRHQGCPSTCRPPRRVQKPRWLQPTRFHQGNPLPVGPSQPSSPVFPPFARRDIYLILTDPRPAGRPQLPAGNGPSRPPVQKIWPPGGGG